MTPAELTARAHAYVSQAMERLNECEGKAAIPEGMLGDWVSLRANLGSAKADLETLTRAG